jgi:hypothetical protein
VTPVTNPFAGTPLKVHDAPAAAAGPALSAPTAVVRVAATTLVDASVTKSLKKPTRRIVLPLARSRHGRAFSKWIVRVGTDRAGSCGRDGPLLRRRRSPLTHIEADVVLDRTWGTYAHSLLAPNDGRVGYGLIH